MDDWNKVAVFTAFSWNKEKVGFSMNPRIQTSLGIHGDTISAWWEWWGVVTVLRLHLRQALPVCPSVRSNSTTWRQRGGREGGRRCFSEWEFINVFLSTGVISVAISVSNGGAFTGLMPDAGGGGTGLWYGRGPLFRQKTWAHAKVSTGHQDSTGSLETGVTLRSAPSHWTKWAQIRAG